MKYKVNIKCAIFAIIFSYSFFISIPFHNVFAADEVNNSQSSLVTLVQEVYEKSENSEELSSDIYESFFNSMATAAHLQIIESSIDHENIIDIAGPFDETCNSINYLTASLETIILCSGQESGVNLPGSLTLNQHNQLYAINENSSIKINVPKGKKTTKLLYGLPISENIENTSQIKDLGVRSFYYAPTRTNFISITTLPKKKASYHAAPKK